jgi:hypothetical protein
MSTILTDDEIATAIAHLYAGPDVLALALPDELGSARAVEAAVLAKLAQQEPVAIVRRSGIEVLGEYGDLIGKNLYTHPAPQQADRQRVPDELDWRHPRIQALIGADARSRICIDLVWRILENPRGEFTASDMEYWDKLHDKVQEVALAAAPEAPAQSNCIQCRNADSWGLPDQPVCKACTAGSAWTPLNQDSVNPNKPALAQKGGDA